MTKWYVLLGDESVCGPFTESQIKVGLRNGKITDQMRIRQGESGWIRVAKVRKLFVGLSTDGIYVRDAEQRVFGPFTESRLRAMHVAGKLPAVYWVRHGLDGNWTLVGQTNSRSAVAQKTSLGASRLPLGGSRIPALNGASVARATIPPAPVMKLRGGSWAHVVAGARSRFERLITGDVAGNITGDVAGNITGDISSDTMASN